MSHHLLVSRLAILGRDVDEDRPRGGGIKVCPLEINGHHPVRATALLMVEQMEKIKNEKWALYNELKKMEAQLTQDREMKLKDIESRVKEAKELVALKENAAREVCH